jgi:hypothetical protein
MTWGEVADTYAEITGVQFNWCPQQEFLDYIYKFKQDPWYWKYDRIYNRDIDCSKILRVTELHADDFAAVKDGILAELAIINRNNC